MNDIEFFKSRVEELREDNRILVETKEMLEEQLASSRKRSEKILELENDIIRFKGDIERSKHERENDRMKMKDLMDENAALHLSQKNSVSESQSLLAEMETMKGNHSGSDLNILSEQLGKDAVSRVHKLELDNQRLQRELEASKAEKSKAEKESVQEFESENRKINANISKLEEQVRASLSLVLQDFISSFDPRQGVIPRPSPDPSRMFCKLRGKTRISRPSSRRSNSKTKICRSRKTPRWKL